MKMSLYTILILMLGLKACAPPAISINKPFDRVKLADSLERLLKENLVDKWYPASIDSVYGGYLSTFDSAFKPIGNQNKMIVSEARHLWNNSKASMHMPDKKYLEYAHHGFTFLKNKMWDKENGGFFQEMDRSGKPMGDSSKTAYGNAFGLFATSAYYQASKDTDALIMAKKAFLWLEHYSHDSIYKGYYQHLSKSGVHQLRSATTASTSELGYKDQNSSIHLLESLAGLYQVWPDPLVKKRLEEMIFLIRDRIVNDKGNLVLFFQPDWTAVSFKDSSHESIMKHHGLDHVSWGHDIETAYLLMEASHIVGWHQDTTTWKIAKKMVDQCLNLGWDDTVGGIYDEGYYFKDKPGVTVIRQDKVWWTQAEALNTLLIMADLYPDDPLHYLDKFIKQWTYIDTYLIDHLHGEWYANGLDKDPGAARGQKGNIWKAGYHQYRSLENCIDRLRGKE